MHTNHKLTTALALLIALHLLIFFAGFIAPYDPSAQNRDFPFAPPTRIHFIDAHGHFHFRPFVYLWAPRADDSSQYEETRQREFPVHFFVRGAKYQLAGIFTSNTHLFGLEAPAKIFLAGTDDYGRDQLSRILYGGQISIAAGLLATAISLSLGLLVGLISGFYGIWVDDLIMRGVELFLVLPWLYVLLAVRMFLPLHIGATEVFFLLVAVIGTIGWARPARLIRGVVLSAKTQKYVIASRGFGASNSHILRKHILPHTYGILLTQAALLIPQYIAAEVTLSFLGLGLGEPTPSWGGLLAALQHYNVMVSYWWMFAPAGALVIVSLGYLSVANAFQQRLQSNSN